MYDGEKIHGLFVKPGYVGCAGIVGHFFIGRTKKGYSMSESDEWAFRLTLRKDRWHWMLFRFWPMG